jgi:oligopeptide transport system permease protein
MRTSLVVGTGAATLAALVGTLYGALAAWAPERAGRLLMRGVDVLYGLPYPFIVLVLASALGPSLVLVLVALGLLGWLGTARLVYAEVRRLAARDFVVAARALGMGEARLLGRHVLPNVLGVIVVSLTLAVPAMVLQEAFFSFLGLGVQPPAPSLGLLVADGAAQVSVFWWTLAAPAGLTAVLLVALQFLGDGVRDALDPRAR